MIARSARRSERSEIGAELAIAGPDPLQARERYDGAIARSARRSERSKIGAELAIGGSRPIASERK